MKSKKLPLGLELVLLYALEYESLLSPVDFFLRRTDILLFSTENLDNWKDTVINYIASYLEWTDKQKEEQTERLEETIARIQLKKLR